MEETGLDRPHVYPTPDGGVQAEWDARGRAFHLTYAPKGRGVSVEGVATWPGGAGSELTETEDHSAVVAWLRQIEVVDA